MSTFKPEEVAALADSGNAVGARALTEAGCCPRGPVAAPPAACHASPCAVGGAFLSCCPVCLHLHNAQPLLPPITLVLHCIAAH